MDNGPFAHLFLSIYAILTAAVCFADDKLDLRPPYYIESQTVQRLVGPASMAPRNYSTSTQVAPMNEDLTGKRPTGAEGAANQAHQILDKLRRQAEQAAAHSDQNEVSVGGRDMHGVVVNQNGVIKGVAEGNGRAWVSTSFGAFGVAPRKGANIQGKWSIGGNKTPNGDLFPFRRNGEPDASHDSQEASEK